jgi:hypothetical protein
MEIVKFINANAYVLATFIVVSSNMIRMLKLKDQAHEQGKAA